MRYIYLNSIQTVRKLCYVCEVYKDFFDTDVSFENQIVDGCSIMGVMELIGKEVKIETHSPNSDIENCFYKEIEDIGGYKKEER